MEIVLLIAFWTSRTAGSPPYVFPDQGVRGFATLKAACAFAKEQTIFQAYTVAASEGKLILRETEISCGWN